MIGRTISHYEITEKLGEGGMGVVYKARDSHLKRFVALKVLPPGTVTDPERKQRFVQEARAASALNHPNIVTVYDIDQAEGIDFIVMEHVEGRTLDEMIGRKGLKLSEALKYAIQVADALAKAHAAGIIHRDLKPGNVMVTGEGRVKVLDFGLAKLTETAPIGAEDSTLTEKPSTESGMIVGTASYMSPEQAEGKQVDARSDIFSFGSVLYEMLTGRRAFKRDTPALTMAAIVSVDPPPLGRNAPPELERLVARCLRKNPDRRFQILADVKVELEDLKEDSDSGKLSSAPAGAMRKSRRWLPAIAVLPVFAVAAWWVWQSQRAAVQRYAVTRFTTDPGAETGPTFSPNGDQLAYSWTPEEGGNSDIYVKWIGTANPLRLTTDPARDFAPAWSPDGRTIAFFREGAGRAQIRLIPALGGPERKLAEVDLPSAFPKIWRLGWSPDSKVLVTSDRSSPKVPYGLVLVGVPSGEKRRLTEPDAGTFGDYDAAISPDGRQLAFTRSDSYTIGYLSLVDLSDGFKTSGIPRRLRSRASDAFRPAWTPGSRELIVSAGGRLQRFSVARPDEAAPLPFGEGGEEPAVSLRGDRLAYTRRREDYDVWRLDSKAAAGAAEQARRLISSTADERHASYSPNGTRIAFTSGRTGTGEIWTCNADGSNPMQVTSSRKGGGNGGPQWSPDGKWIAFDARTAGSFESTGKGDIWMVAADGGEPRLLTVSKAAEISPSWSRDGRWVYFASDRTGVFEVWRQPPEGGTAEQVTRRGGFGSAESVDGKWVYCSREIGGGALVRVPVGGGEETQVADSLASWASFAVAQDGVYFVPAVEPGSAPVLRFYQFEDRSVKTVLQLKPTTLWGTLRISHDFRFLLYAQRNQEDADLTLVENFR